MLNPSKSHHALLWFHKIGIRLPFPSIEERPHKTDPPQMLSLRFYEPSTRASGLKETRGVIKLMSSEGVELHQSLMTGGDETQCIWRTPGDYSGTGCQMCSHIHQPLHVGCSYQAWRLLSANPFLPTEGQRCAQFPALSCDN